jgi:colanic acid/amylovoran biosynthesis glycosyltransferase
MSSIVFFLDRYPNLSETFVSDQITGLLTRGENIRIVAICGDPGEISAELEEQFQMSGRVLYLTKPRPPRWNAIFRALTIFRHLGQHNVRQALRSELFGPCSKKGFLAEIVSNWPTPIHADVIISHFGTTSVTALALQKLGLLQGRLLPIFHGYDVSQYEVQQLYSQWYRSLFSASSKVLAISQLWLQRLQTMGCPPDKLMLLRMGVDLNKFRFRPRCSPQGAISIISVGRLTEKKGFITALKGIRVALDLGVKLRYTIIGDGHQKPLLTDLINKLDIAESVTLTGSIAPALLPQYLEQADIFMLTSETAANGDMEGIPVSLMEAMATGLITVSTYHSGIPELITHQQSGFLIAERDENALGHLLRDIAIRHYDLEQIQQAARNKISHEFNQQFWVNRLQQICSELVNAP